MKRLKQRLISWILAVVMILSMVPTNVFAATATANGLTEPELIVFTADGEEVEVKELTTSGNYSIQLQKGTDIVISSGVGKITNILKLEPEINENGEAAVSSDDLEALTIEAMGMPPGMIESIKQNLINNEGLVMTDISNELATLSIAIEGIEYTRELYVELLPEKIPVTGVTLDQEAVELEIGATATLKATVTPEDATDKTVTWTSSDEAVATVKDGVVTAVKAGTATITAKAGEFEATCVVTVKPETYEVTIPEDEAFTVTGAKTAIAGEDYKFTVELSAGYQAGENFAVKVNGEAAKVGANGNYIVENVSAAIKITVEGVEEIITEPVKVYFSISDDAGFVVGKDSDEVMALKEIEVPYFDLSLYGMENFYFQSESYSDDGDGLPGSSLEPGTAQFAYGKTTVLHLYIYATEVFYCGIEPENAGKGYLYNENLIGTSTFSYSGSVGSIYFTQLWGMDENMNYYVNHQYPLASEGWGSTADQILLREGDIITIGHFSEWNFYTDPASVFNYIKAGEETVTTSAAQGDKVELSVYLAGADESGKYSTAHTPVTVEPEVFYISVDELSEGDVTAWNSIGCADVNGNITFNTKNLRPGQYIVAIAGQYGEELTESICSTPGAILLTIEEGEFALGDVNMDGEIDILDANLVASYFNNAVELTDKQIKLADVNGDGEVDILDANLIASYFNGGIDSFPAEA